MTQQDQPAIQWWQTGPARVVMSVAAVGVAVVGVYVWRFRVQHPAPSLSPDPAHWGQLGDYVGGLLNPLVALAALYLLAWSIGLQKKELAETRSTLDKTAKAQQAQVRLSALTALVNSTMTEVQIQRMYLEHLSRESAAAERARFEAGRTLFPEQARGGASPAILAELAGASFTVKDLQGNSLNPAALQARISELNESIAELLLARLDYESEIKFLLARARTNGQEEPAA